MAKKRTHFPISCAALTSLCCDSPGWGRSTDHTGQAGPPLRSAGCTLAVGWCSLSPHTLLLEEQEPAPPLAHTLYAGRGNTKYSLSACVQCVQTFLCVKTERVRSKNTPFTFVLIRYDGGMVTVRTGDLSVTDAARCFGCVDRLSGVSSATVVQSETDTETHAHREVHSQYSNTTL